jgi:hypothetical protein
MFFQMPDSLLRKLYGVKKKKKKKKKPKNQKKKNAPESNMFSNPLMWND